MLDMVLAQSNNGGAAGGIGALLLLLIYLAILALIIVGGWKMFVKAGQPGWGILVPILNIYFMLKIAGRPGWWLLLMLIPIVSIVVAIIMWIDIAKSFGKGIGFALGLVFLPFIFMPILGFGDAQYQGPAAA